jgi:arylsulfatase A-like enzyme
VSPLGIGLALVIGCTDVKHAECPVSAPSDVIEDMVRGCSPFRDSRTDLWMLPAYPDLGRANLDQAGPGLAAALLPHLPENEEWQADAPSVGLTNAKIVRYFEGGLHLERIATGAPAFVTIPIGGVIPQGAALELYAFIHPPETGDRVGSIYWLTDTQASAGEWFQETRSSRVRYRGVNAWQWHRAPLPDLGDEPLRSLRIDIPKGATSLLLRFMGWSTSPVPLSVDVLVSGADTDIQEESYRLDGTLRPGLVLAGDARVGFEVEDTRGTAPRAVEFEWASIGSSEASTPSRLTLTANGETLLTRELRGTSEPRWVTERIELPPRTPSMTTSLEWTVEGSAKATPSLLLGTPRISSRVERPPAVILVTLDTTRADRVSLFSPELGTTPGLARIASSPQSVRYWKHYSQSSVTTSSHASLLTGLYPPTLGVLGNSAWKGQGPRLGDEFVTLAETYRAAGYDTGAFVSAFPISAELGFGQGFDAFDGPKKDASRNGLETVAKAREWLSGRVGRPVFLWLHLYDPHAPYNDAPAAIRERFAPEMVPLSAIDRRLLEYDSEIYYADVILDSLQAELAAGWREEDTLLAVTSDHGESIGERGMMSAHFGLYDINLRIPLLVRYPLGVAVAGRNDVRAPTENVDLAVTMLRTSGLPTPEGLPGRNLLQTLDPDRATFAWWQSASSITRGSSRLVKRDTMHRLVRSGGQEETRAEGIELYDLALDPAEENDLADRDPERRENLLRELAAVAEMSASRSAATSNSEGLSDEQRAMLEALGYTIPEEDQ